MHCIGKGTNWWSCVHVEDLADAYVVALTEAAPGSAYAVVDDEPLRLRELTDLTVAAMGLSPVGTAPPPLLNLFLGGTLVRSVVTSFRISGRRIRDDLGWAPSRPRFRDEVSTTVASIG